MSDLYDPITHDYSGTSSIGKHRSCVLCGSPRSSHNVCEHGGQIYRLPNRSVNYSCFICQLEQKDEKISLLETKVSDLTDVGTIAHTLYEVESENARLENSLKKTEAVIGVMEETIKIMHDCATYRGDGECDGCLVSRTLSTLNHYREGKG